jgi:hypothetical protein
MDVTKLNHYLQDGGELQELIDEEMWLELALHHIDYDISTDNIKAQDKVIISLSLFFYSFLFCSGMTFQKCSKFSLTYVGGRNCSAPMPGMPKSLGSLLWKLCACRRCFTFQELSRENKAQ